MKTQHTPGPWKEQYGDIRTATGKVVVYDEGILFTGSEEQQANGHLILAAPELLEALKGILNSELGRHLEADTVQTLGRASGKTYLSERMKEARAAIDKAEVRG
jgi:hypothetical protein